jgi:hypothetical protein
MNRNGWCRVYHYIAMGCILGFIAAFLGLIVELGYSIFTPTADICFSLAEFKGCFLPELSG